jgi:hypothetical protein
MDRIHPVRAPQLYPDPLVAGKARDRAGCYPFDGGGTIGRALPTIIACTR